MTTKRTTFWTTAMLTGVLAGVWGCSDSAGLTTPVGWRSPSAPTPAASALSDVVANALNDTLQDELKAETTYLGVLGDFGDVWPFANIVHAEERHAASVAGLFRNRGLTVPASLWTLDNVPHFGSLADACEAAAAAERENVALYDRYLALDLPFDVRRVFENNRAASLENHLPAFESCSCPACQRS